MAFLCGSTGVVAAWTSLTERAPEQMGMMAPKRKKPERGGIRVGFLCSDRLDGQSVRIEAASGPLAP